MSEPWEYCDADDGRCGGEQVEAPTPPAVYEGDWPVCWLNNGEVTKDEVERRGRILAAAPDLLAACKAALLKLDYRPLDKISVAADMLRAAIAKAEGQP